MQPQNPDTYHSETPLARLNVAAATITTVNVAIAAAPSSLIGFIYPPYSKAARQSKPHNKPKL